jgi:hypothetical protein
MGEVADGYGGWTVLVVLGLLWNLGGLFVVCFADKISRCLIFNLN